MSSPFRYKEGKRFHAKAPRGKDRKGSHGPAAAPQGDGKRKKGRESPALPGRVRIGGGGMAILAMVHGQDARAT